MKEALQDALNRKYKGRMIRANVTWDELESEELLSESAMIVEEDLEITEAMSIAIIINEDNSIKEVCVGFHTFCQGDSDLGEEDPKSYWSFEECLAAAEKYLNDILTLPPLT